MGRDYFYSCCLEYFLAIVHGGNLMHKETLGNIYS